MPLPSTLFTDVEKLYESVPKVDRMIIPTRFPQLAVEQVDSFVPKQGLVIDMGCGRGELAHCLVALSPDRSVHGVDLAEGKIATAKVSAETSSSITFAVEDVCAYTPPKCVCIIYSQILYLISFKDQEKTLKQSVDALEEGGVIILSLFFREKKTAFIHACFRITDRILSVFPKIIRNPLKKLRAKLFGERIAYPSFREPESYEQLLESYGCELVARLSRAQGTLPPVTGGSGCLIVAKKLP